MLNGVALEASIADRAKEIMASVNAQCALEKETRKKERQRAQAALRPIRRRGKRKTYLVDKLRIDTTRGLPDNIRSRLILLAYHEKRHQVWLKVTKLIKGMINAEMKLRRADVFKNLMGEIVVPVEKKIAIVDNSLRSPLILEWGGHSRFAIGSSYLPRDGFSMSSGVSADEIRKCCITIIKDARHKSKDEVELLRLLQWLEEKKLFAKLYELRRKSDGVKPGYDRVFGKWMLRGKEGKTYLLVDDAQGIRIESPEEVPLFELPGC